METAVVIDSGSADAQGGDMSGFRDDEQFSTAEVVVLCVASIAMIALPIILAIAVCFGGPA